MNRTFVALAALLASACGSSSSTGNGAMGAMNVRLVDAPGPYAKIELDVQKVEIRSDASGWLTLGTPGKVIDLLSLTGGVAETLASGASLPAGSYGQLRLVLGPSSQVTLQDGSVQPLKVPSGMQSGVKLNVHFDVAAGTTKDVFVDFDASRSIFVHMAGMSGQYLLRPVVCAVDRVVTGSIAGKLTDAQTGAGIAGAIVMAETVDAVTGAPAVIRSALTGADGSYTLDLLPVGATYYVVSQPVSGTVSYGAQASAPLAITQAAPTAPWSAAFTPALTGSAGGSVTPTATLDDADTVVATQTLQAHDLVVRTAAATVANGVESWSLTALPAGVYGVAIVRRTVDSTGAETEHDGVPVNVTVASGAQATVDLVAP